MLDGQHLAALKQAHAQPGRRPCLTQAKIQRVQVAAAPVDETTDIGVTAKHRAHPGALHQAHVVAEATAQQLRVILLEVTHMARLQCHIHIAVLEIAVDGVFFHPLGDEAIATPADIPDEICRHRTQPLGHQCLAAETANYLPAVPARGAPADAVLFQHHHRVAALGEAERRGDAGKTAAANTDIRLDFSCQHRIAGIGVTGGRIVGLGIGLVDHWQVARGE